MLGLDVSYHITKYNFDNISTPQFSEQWHTLHGVLRFHRKYVVAEAGGNLIYRNAYSTLIAFEPQVVLRFIPIRAISIFGKYSGEHNVPPWQWTRSFSRITNPGSLTGESSLTKLTGGVQLQPWKWLVLTSEFIQTGYQDWYRLTYTSPIAQFDSSLTVQRLNGSGDQWASALVVHGGDWFDLGAKYSLYPGWTDIVPELWSRQQMSGWTHIQRYFFRDNLLVHVYVEGGMYMSREPVGWDPMLQSLTYYPLRTLPADLYYAHLLFAGEIGPFTISTSFYNFMGNNMIFAIDQRPQTELFYLGVRWQFWN